MPKHGLRGNAMEPIGRLLVNGRTAYWPPGFLASEPLLEFQYGRLEERLVGGIRCIVLGVAQGFPIARAPARATLESPLLRRPSAGNSIPSESGLGSVMAQAQVRRLPVLDERGAPLGIVSLSDVAREAEREMTEAQPEISEMEVRSTLAADLPPHGQHAGRLSSEAPELFRPEPLHHHGDPE